MSRFNGNFRETKGPEGKDLQPSPLYHWVDWQLRRSEQGSPFLSKRIKYYRFSSFLSACQYQEGHTIQMDMVI